MPPFLIGGIPENFGSCFGLGQGKQFILEGDEYDTAFFDKGPKFLHYFPDAVILTSVEFDHADIYKDLDEVKTAFKRLVNLVPRRGDAGSRGTATRTSDLTVPREPSAGSSATASPTANWRNRRSDVHEPNSTAGPCCTTDKPWAEFEFPLGRRIQLLNATAAAAMAANYGIPEEVIAEALRTFRSVKRRLEVKAEINGITIIDDFAHHPTAIEQTIQRSAHPLSGSPPVGRARASLQHAAPQSFQDELAQSLAQADEVVMAAIFKSEAIPEAERLDPNRVIAEIRSKASPRASCPTPMP